MSVGPSTEKAIIRRLLEEAVNKGNLEAVDQILAPDATVHPIFDHPSLPSDADGHSGRADLKSIVRAQREAFPEVHVEVDEMFHGGGSIIVFTTTEGTTGQGRHASWRSIVIIHFHGAKIADLWFLSDQLGMARQLGLVPDSPELRRIETL
jgi:ketosteroid isomerase-like protein